MIIIYNILYNIYNILFFFSFGSFLFFLETEKEGAATILFFYLVKLDVFYVWCPALIKSAYIKKLDVFVFG